MAGKQITTGILLTSAGEIQAAYGWTRDQFVMFLALGLPVRKINKCWYGHSANIDKFLEALLKTQCKPIVVDTDKIPADMAED
jgi:hypothetical protein